MCREIKKKLSFDCSEINDSTGWKVLKACYLRKIDYYCLNSFEMVKTISINSVGRLFSVCFLAFQCLQAVALPLDKYKLMIAPGTITENSVTLLWDKQYANGNVVYEVLLNGKVVASTAKTN